MVKSLRSLGSLLEFNKGENQDNTDQSDGDFHSGCQNISLSHICLLWTTPGGWSDHTIIDNNYDDLSLLYYIDNSNNCNLLYCELSLFEGKPSYTIKEYYLKKKRLSS